jgi:hypothetical protein
MRFLARGLAVLVGLSMFVAAAIAQGAGPLAPAGAPPGEPYLIWMIKSLGFCGLLSLLTGLAVFVGACVVVVRVRRPAVIASYLVFLLLPSLFAILGGLKGTVASFSVLARSEVEIKQWQIFAGLSEALLPFLIALVLTLPSYLVIAIGLFRRTLQAQKGIEHQQ